MANEEREFSFTTQRRPLGEDAIPLGTEADPDTAKAVGITTAENAAFKDGVVEPDYWAIPDKENLQAHYDFRQEDGNLPVADQTGNGFSLDQGSYSGVGATINGYQAGEFDGSDVIYPSTWASLSQPTVVYVVINFQSGDRIIGGDPQQDRQILRGLDNNFGIWAGNGVNGGAADSVTIGTGRFDGANSVVREGGTETASGDPGSQNMDLPSFGGDSDNDTYGVVNIGEVMIYNVGHSNSTMADVENHLSSKWDESI